MKKFRSTSNILDVINHHIGRVLPPNWWKGVKDYRYRSNQEWNLGYILEVLMAGALSGCKTLREVETLSELYAERVPDTTLHDMLVQMDPKALQTKLAQGVKQALREHELPRQEFPIRLIAIDGKYNFNTSMPINECSEVIGGGGNDEQYRHMALRAMYVSSVTKLYLGQHEIRSKGSETQGLIPFIDELQAQYGRTGLLEVISIDAGMVSKKNAQELIDRGLGYIMALKGTQKRLFSMAQEFFKDAAPPQHVEEEIYNGKQVTRKLSRVCVPETIKGWEHLKEFWKVEKSSVAKDGSETETEIRYFIVSLSPTTLTDQQALAAVRMHWGIENNGNWCFDVFWKKDAHPWTSRAMAFVSHLRMMAYNIIERLKTRRLKAQKRRALSWKDLFFYFEHALMRSRHAAQLQGKALPAFR